MNSHKDYAHKLISVQKQIKVLKHQIFNLEAEKKEIGMEWVGNEDLPAPSPFNDTTLVFHLDELELWEITIDEDMDVTVRKNHNLFLSGDIII